MSKNMVLIGGSTGIGLNLTELLKEEYSVTIISRNNPELLITQPISRKMYSPT